MPSEHHDQRQGVQARVPAQAVGQHQRLDPVLVALAVDAARDGARQDRRAWSSGSRWRRSHRMALVRLLEAALDGIEQQLAGRQVARYQGIAALDHVPGGLAQAGLASASSATRTKSS